VVLLTLICSSLAACCGGPKSNVPPPREAAASQSYKIELVVQGLATLSPKREGTWVFLGNTDDVSKLKFSTDPSPAEGTALVLLAKHEPRLLFPKVEDLPAGVTLTSAGGDSEVTACEPGLNPPKPGLPRTPPKTLRGLDIRPLHLTLVGDISTPPAPFSGGAVGKEPCEPGSEGCEAHTSFAEQQQDYRWVRNLTETLALTHQSGAFRQELFAPSYRPQSPTPVGAEGYPLLAARLFLDKGSLQSGRLIPGKNTQFATYKTEGVSDWGTRAVADQVQVELEATGDVQIMGRSLADAAQPPKPLLTISSTQGQTVRLLIANDPVAVAGGEESVAACVGTHVDWVMALNYLATAPAREHSLELRAEDPPDTDPRGSCSPSTGG
jgi:hypothetical protein